VAGLTGIDTHITFWEQLTNGDNFEFAALLWKGDLPRLPIEAPRLNGFTALDLENTIRRMGDIFDLSRSLPSSATFRRIENVHPQMVALQTEIGTIRELVSQSSPITRELQQSFQRLLQISRQLSLSTIPAAPPNPLQATHLQTFAQNLKQYFEIVIIPNGPVNLYQVYLQVEAASDLPQRFRDLSQIQNDIGASGIVPATIPSPLDASILRGYIQQLTTHLNNQSDINAFKEAVHTKISPPQRSQLPKVAFRYYFFIGLPLLMDVLVDYRFYILNSLANEAIRSFMRAQWQGALPSRNSIARARINQAAARQVSLLTEKDSSNTDTHRYFNPYPEFDDNINKVP
jgi:hypothetical protein